MYLVNIGLLWEVGSDRLRENIAALYSNPTVTKDSILTTNGGIVANQIVLQALLSPGNHVIVMYPTYEQLYQTPRMLGAEENTKMIVLNSPNNPTGAHLSVEKQQDIIAIAQENDLIIFCDEVFYPLFRLSAKQPPPQSFIDLGYKNIVIIGSLSKAYSLAGTRVGRIASTSKDLLEMTAAMRHYTTISVSQIDEAVAAEALADRCRRPLLSRAKEYAETNTTALEKFVDENSGCCLWVKPVSRNTAMLLFTRNGRPVDDKELCLSLLSKYGVLLCPASVCFSDGASLDFQGYVCVGVAIDKAEMANALCEMRKIMSEDFENILFAQAYVFS
ncbi:pyridoxal phosphate-dependent transferase [Aspergillus tetrazonus]